MFNDLGGNVLRLFSGDPLAVAIAHLDASQLRAQAWAVRVAPPGASASSPAAVAEHPEEENMFMCTARRDGGGICGLKFASRQALCTHLRLKVGGGHGCVAWCVVLTGLMQCSK